MDIQAIYERQYSRVYRIAMLYLKNSSDAEDVVQSIFLKYMEKQTIFENSDHERAWFITAVRNQCKDVLKNFWRRKVDFGDLPEQVTEEADGRDLITFILKLSSKYREVLYLYYYEEYSVKEMSRILGRKESTIQTQLAAAREKLKKLIEGKERAGYVG